MLISINKEDLNAKVMAELAKESGTWYIMRGFGMIEPCNIAIPKRIKNCNLEKLLQVKRLVIDERSDFYCFKILDESVLFDSEWLIVHDGAYLFAYNVVSGAKTPTELVEVERTANSILIDRIKEKRTEEIGKWTPWSSFRR